MRTSSSTVWGSMPKASFPCSTAASFWPARASTSARSSRIRFTPAGSSCRGMSWRSVAGQPLEVALRRVDVAQRLERPLAGRVGGQHGLVGLDGLGRVAQLHAHQPAQLVVEPRHLAPVHGGGDADAQVRRQLAPPLQLLQQLLERRQRLLVAGPQPQHLAPQLDRLLGPPQLGHQRRLLGQQPLAGGAVAHHRALRRQVGDQLLLAAGRLVERLQGLQRRQVARVDRQGLLVGVGRLGGRRQPLLAEPAQPVGGAAPDRRRWPPAARACSTSASSGQASSRWRSRSSAGSATGAAAGSSARARWYHWAACGGPSSFSS